MINHVAGSINGYNIAMVPHEEPVENDTNAARMKVMAGTKYGDSDISSMLFEIKVAVCICSVISATDHARIRISTAVSMVRKPLMRLSMLSLRLNIRWLRVSTIATRTLDNDDHRRAV